MILPQLLGALALTVPAPEAFDHEHAAWSALLQVAVKGDRVDYPALAKRHAELDRVLATYHAVTPEVLAGFDEKQRFAFWINVYNTTVADLILDNLPLRSIQDLSTDARTIWSAPLIPMPAHHPDGTGKPLSLDDLEHRILRPKFEDARVHVAVNCASISCPPLLPKALRAKTLDADLDAAMRAFLADTQRNRLDGTPRLSKIFEWFRADFERDGKSLGAYLARYAPKGKAQALRDAKFEFLPYDWALNTTETKGKSLSR